VLAGGAQVGSSAWKGDTGLSDLPSAASLLLRRGREVDAPRLPCSCVGEELTQELLVAGAVVEVLAVSDHADRDAVALQGGE
jgi:hypothetical protein